MLIADRPEIEPSKYNDYFYSFLSFEMRKGVNLSCNGHINTCGGMNSGEHGATSG